MQLKHQLKLVKFKLDNIFQLHEKLSDEGRLSTIDFDLLMKNMMEAYEFYHILKMESVLWQQSDPEATGTIVDEEIEAPEEEAKSEAENDAKSEEVVIENAEDEVFEEPINEAVNEKEGKKNIVSPNKLSLFTDEGNEESIPETSAIENVEVEEISINEEQEFISVIADEENNEGVIDIQEPQQEEVEEQVSVSSEIEESIKQIPPPEEKVFEQEPIVQSAIKVPPIESAIAINDKFIYIRELFGGDFDAYEQTIFEINKLDNRKDALDYLSDKVTDRFNWLDKEDIANDFFALVQKHFDF